MDTYVTAPGPSMALLWPWFWGLNPQPHAWAESTFPEKSHLPGLELNYPGEKKIRNQTRQASSEHFFMTF